MSQIAQSALLLAFTACDAAPSKSAVETGKHPSVQRPSTLLARARAATEPRASLLRYQAAQLLEVEWRSGNPAALVSAVSAYRAVGAGENRCRALVRALTLEAEAENEPAQARLELAQLAIQEGCQHEVKRTPRSFVSGSTGDGGVEPESSPAPVIPQPLHVVKVERYGSPEAARIVVFLNRASRYEVGELPRTAERGPRLYVDIPDATYGGAKQFHVGGAVERVRMGLREDGVRVALDLGDHARRRVFHLPEPFRLIVDVSATAQLGATERRAGHIRRVVLDPGHGGHDPGATGIEGLREKDVVLDVAHRAAPLIARELGVSTLLTRDTDHYVPLDERVAKANAFNADLFISLHCNASESHASHGVMTFVLDVSQDSLAERTAARENSASAAASRQFANAMVQVMDSRASARSVHFAELLQRASVASLRPHYPDIINGGVRRAGFYVLAGARMPAVLFEASFISNPTEERRLDSGLYRQRLADAVVNAIRAYQAGR